MTNNKSGRWPIAMIVAVCIFILLGCASLFYLRGNLHDLRRWFSCVSLVVGVGLWTRQNWARWVGVVWAGFFFVKDVLSIMGLAEFNRQAMTSMVRCLVFLCLIAILFGYPFKEKAQLSPPAISEGGSD